MDETVTVTAEGPAAYITLNRPAKLNALSAELVDRLRGAIASVASDDDVKIVVLSGAGRAFSAGFDLGEEAADGPKTADAWHRELGQDVAVTLDLWRLPKPTIAAVRGWCLAGGCELAMACDMIIAADDARFGEPEIRYGSGPATLLMPFLIGQKKTSELLFTGDVIDAAEAKRIGLVNKVVPADELEDAVRALIAKLAPTPLPVLRYTKLSLLRAWEAMGVQQAVAAHVDLSAILNACQTPERREFSEIAVRDGLKAALSWRDARYGGSSEPAGGPAGSDAPR